MPLRRRRAWEPGAGPGRPAPVNRLSPPPRTGRRRWGKTFSGTGCSTRRPGGWPFRIPGRSSNLSKVRLRHAPAFLPCLEIFRRAEVEHRGDEVGREGLELAVVRHHRVVVELARERELVLRRGQLLLD